MEALRTWAGPWSPGKLRILGTRWRGKGPGAARRGACWKRRTLCRPQVWSRWWLCVPSLHPRSLSPATQPPPLWACPLQVPAPGPELTSTSHLQFQPPQRLQQTNVALLGRESVGNKVRPGAPTPHPKSPRRPDLTGPLGSSCAGAHGVHPEQPELCPEPPRP